MRAVSTTALLFVCALSAMAQDSEAIKKEKAKLTKLEKAYTSAKKEFNSAKTSASKKKNYVAATGAYADAVLVARSLESKVKYPKALRLYREVLKVDPKNKSALANKKMIEDIYKSLGKPIPK